MGDARQAWAENQRALAKALDLSIEEWIEAISRASQRQTALTAATIGAAVAKGIPMTAVIGVDGPSLGRRAVALIDPTPPRVEHPVLREAVRRAADGLGTAKGASRLKRGRAPVSTPLRGTGSIGSSATTATPDAPGEEEP